MVTSVILGKDNTQDSRKGSHEGFWKRITPVILERDNTYDFLLRLSNIRQLMVSFSDSISK